MKETRKDTEPEVRNAPTRESLRAQRAFERLGEESKAPANSTSTSADKSPYRNKPFDSSYQSMLFGSAGTLAKPAWSDSTHGRMVIRFFTRGIMGAAMFAAAGRYSRLQLSNYNPETFEWSQTADKPLQAIAKVTDVVFGKPISAMARAFTSTKGLSAVEAGIAKDNAAWNAVNFRGTAYLNTIAGRLDSHGRPSTGRSLGAEMVSVSFDFAMMSVGDAVGRNFIQMVDPHIRKTWMINDQGDKAKEGEKSHFSPQKFLKSIGWSAWRIISKNQGEDWAVALPYVYQMRLQRKLLSRAFSNEGSDVKLVLDNSWNGGAFKTNSEGKIFGDYALPGAIDLHTRFVGYNFYTLMFREAYDTIGHKLKNWRDDNYSLNMEPPKDLNPLHLVKDTTRYIAKSFIKANLYMNPAVVPFWIMRVPQSKWRGALINTEAAMGTNAFATTISHDQQVAEAIQEAAAAGKQITEADMLVRQNGQLPIYNYNATRHRLYPGNPGQLMRDGATASDPSLSSMYLHNTKVPNPLYGMRGPNDSRIYETYEKGFSKSFSQTLNPFGQFSHWLGGKAERLAEKLPDGAVKRFIGIDESKILNGIRGPEASTAGGRRAFMRNYVDAGLSYYPYFFSKAELGLRVDDTPTTGGRGKMDNAIYGLIDNVCALNPHKSVASVKEMWRLSTTRERALRMREGNDSHPDPIVPAEVVHGQSHTPVNAAAPAIPATVVQPEGRTKDPVIYPANKGAELSTSEHTEMDAQQDKKWAEAVSGKHLEAQFLPGNSHTRH